MATDRTGQTTDFSNQNVFSQTKTDEFDVNPQNLDSPENKETSYTPDWDKWHGYYRKIPELRAVIDKFASWTFGRGIKADEKNKKKLKKIIGNGKESSRIVLKNQWRVALICGDSFAEIPKDNQKRNTNLKPLNPSTIKVIYDEFGIIKRYEQWSGKTKTNTWETNEIFHLSNQRIGDETHGIPFPEALVDLIEARNESLKDLRVLYHRNIKPIQFFEVETDDQTKLNDVESTINSAYNKSENIVIPSGVISEIKNTSIPQYGNMDSLPYVK